MLAVAVPAWWLAMAAWPSLRGRFELDPGHRAVLDAYRPSDLVILAGGSAVAAVLLGRSGSAAGRAAGAARAATLVVAGGWATTTLTLAGWVLAGGHGWMGLPPMVAGTALTIAVAVTTRER